MTSTWYREQVDPNPRLPKRNSRKLDSVVVQIDYKEDIELNRYPSLSYYRRLNKEDGGSHWGYQGVYNALIGKAKSAYGYRWMWVDDWEEYLKNKKDGK